MMYNNRSTDYIIYLVTGYNDKSMFILPPRTVYISWSVVKGNIYCWVGW